MKNFFGNLSIELVRNEDPGAPRIKVITPSFTNYYEVKVCIAAALQGVGI